jgi:hypothetical protein
MAYYEGRATIGQLEDRARNMAEGFTHGRRVDNNTYQASYQDGTIRLILHRTPIITTQPDGAIIVDTGGYNTHTTRDRLNKFLPRGWGVYTEQGTIYLSRYLGDGERQAPIPFARTATIRPDDTVTADMSPSDLMADRKLVSRFIDHVRKVGLPKPEDSGGDPWLWEPGQVDETVARDWLEGLYFTRRCYVLALKKAHMSDQGIAYSLALIDRNGGKLDRIDLSRVRRLLRAPLGRAS